MTIESKQSYSSSESDFNDDSDLEDLGLGNDDLSAHIKDWTSGAQAYTKSSQFVIEDMEQDTRQNNKSKTIDIMNQIDNQFGNDNHANEHDSIFTDVTDHTSNTFSRKPNYHEATGTASVRNHDTQSNSLYNTLSDRYKSKTKSSTMKKMSISGKKNNKSSKTSNLSKKTFQSIPQAPDDVDDFDFDDTSSYNKRTKERLSKPADVDDIANQYLFSSKKTIRIPSSFSKLKRMKKGQANYDDLLAQSEAILKGTISMTEYGMKTSNGMDQGTVVFTYDEDLHDFVPIKESKNAISSKSHMNQWWRTKQKTIRSASRHTNKNFDKMVRFSSDRHKYGLPENSEEGDDLNNTSTDNYHNDSKSVDLEAINVQNNFRAAIIYICFVTILALIFTISLSLGKPWVDRESHDHLPELDIDYREKVIINGTNNDDIDFEYNDDPDIDVDYNNISETEFLLRGSSNDQAMTTEHPVVLTFDAPTASPRVSYFPSHAKDTGKVNEIHWTKDTIVNILQPVSSTDSLYQLGTVQNKAMMWLIEKDSSVEFNTDSSNPERLIQRFIVIVLYYSFGGHELWLNKDSWLSEKHECEWFGIHCIIDVISRDPVVIGIDLKGNGLSGSIPSEIGYLKHLSKLIILLYLCLAKILLKHYIQFSFNYYIGNLSLPDNKIAGQMPLTLLQVETLCKYGTIV